MSKGLGITAPCGLNDGRCTLLWVSVHVGLGFKFVVWLGSMPTFGYHLLILLQR